MQEFIDWVLGLTVSEAVLALICIAFAFGCAYSATNAVMATVNHLTRQNVTSADHVNWFEIGIWVLATIGTLALALGTGYFFFLHAL